MQSPISKNTNFTIRIIDIQLSINYLKKLTDLTTEFICIFNYGSIVYLYTYIIRKFFTKFEKCYLINRTNLKWVKLIFQIQILNLTSKK